MDQKKNICSFICQLVVVFAFIGSHSLSTCYFRTWLCVMTTITLIGTLLGLEGFVIIVAIVVGLV
jgi:hypothetical protein